MKIEFGIEDWSSGDQRFIHESALPREGRLAGTGTIEGSVRIVDDAGARIRIYDDLVALFANLGGDAPVHCLDRGMARYDWLLTVHNGNPAVIVEGGDVVVEFDGARVRGPAGAMWPALVAAALRFAEQVAAARPPQPLPGYFAEPVERARALVAARGWALLEAPAEDPPPVPVPRPVLAWGGVELFGSPEAAAFYRDVLGPGFDAVTIRPSTRNVSAQWLGIVVGGDGAALGARLVDEGTPELAGDATHRVWWGVDAEVGWAAQPSAIPVARHVLRSLNPAKAAQFYAGAFGWTHEGERLMCGGREMGVLQATADGESSHWRHYLAVADVGAALARALARGAKQIDRDGDAVWLQDPYGGAFGLAPR